MLRWSPTLLPRKWDCPPCAGHTRDYTERMPDEWFCEIAGREIGPLSSQQLQTMTAKGQILPTDLVRRRRAGAGCRPIRRPSLSPPNRNRNREARDRGANRFPRRPR